MAGPLAGITVIECASMYVGPVATQYLGDMGAEVIKVESPGGDLTRSMGPRESEDMGAFFLSCNRNKRSIVLDLQTPSGRNTLDRLVQHSDVMVSSIRPEAAQRLGISYEQVAQQNSSMIHCHVSGFSARGPYGGRPAYDDVVQAASGLADLQRVVAGEPRYLPTILADKLTGLNAAFAVVNALVHRERTGRGQQVSVPMFESVVAFNMLEHLWGHAFEPPKGPMGYQPVSRATRRPFATRDGHMCLLPYLDRHWKRFFEVVGEEQLTDDPRFGTFQGRQQNQELVWSEVGRHVVLKTTDEWVQILQHEDIPFSVVASLEDLVVDPHLEATGFWSSIEHPTEGTLRIPGIPIEMSDSVPSVRRPPPRLGEHTEQVLREHGFTEDEIVGIVDPHDDTTAREGGA